MLYLTKKCAKKREKFLGVNRGAKSWLKSSVQQFLFLTSDWEKDWETDFRFCVDLTLVFSSISDLRWFDLQCPTVGSGRRSTVMRTEPLVPSEGLHSAGQNMEVRFPNPRHLQKKITESCQQNNKANIS